MSVTGEQDQVSTIHRLDGDLYLRLMVLDLDQPLSQFLRRQAESLLEFVPCLSNMLPFK